MYLICHDLFVLQSISNMYTVCLHTSKEISAPINVSRGGYQFPITYLTTPSISK